VSCPNEHLLSRKFILWQRATLKKQSQEYRIVMWFLEKLSDGIEALLFSPKGGNNESTREEGRRFEVELVENIP
jgi:hypothetical protein